jgi:hypothetical protein
LKLLKQFVKNIIGASARYPITLFCALAACVLFIYQNHLPSASSNALKGNLVRWAIECTAGISLFFAFHIYSENKNLDWAKRLGFILLGTSILVLHFYSIPNDAYNFALNYTLRYFTIILCFHLVISFSLYNTGQEINWFWRFNEYLFVRISTSVLFTAVLFIGISGAIWAVDVLFGINIPNKYYIDVLLVCLFVLNTLFFLYSLPNDTHDFEKEQPYKESLRIFLQYILIPICFLYGSILLIYLGKIIITKNFPKGWVAWPILIFSAIGILTYLLAYPIRQSATTVIKWFCTNFHYFLLPMIAMYLISLGKRVSLYGITEQRYLALGLGIWLAFVCLYNMISKKDNIIFYPISLCILLALSSFGPWGMYRLSATNQYNRLLTILENNKAIENNKIVKPLKKNWNKADKKQIESIIHYLYTHNQMKLLKDVLPSSDSAKLNKLIQSGFDERNVGVLLGLGESPTLNSKGEPINYFTCTSNLPGFQNLPLHTNGLKNVLQIVAIDYSTEEGAEPPLITDTNQYFALLDKNKLYIIKQNDTVIQLLLDEYTQKLKTETAKVLGNTSFFDNTFTNLTLPYTSQVLNRADLQYQSKEIVLYVDEVKCLQTTSKTTAIYLNGYAIF